MPEGYTRPVSQSPTPELAEAPWAGAAHSTDGESAQRVRRLSADDQHCDTAVGQLHAMLLGRAQSEAGAPAYKLAVLESPGVQSGKLRAYLIEHGRLDASRESRAG